MAYALIVLLITMAAGWGYWLYRNTRKQRYRRQRKRESDRYRAHMAQHDVQADKKP